MRQTTDQTTWLFILLPVLIALLVGLMLHALPHVWARTVGADDARRNHTVDGARGLLSLWVLTHHLNMLAILMHPGASFDPRPTAVRSLMNSSFFTAPFYAMTAMLFGGALLARSGRMDSWRFLRSRFYRLAPVYAVSIVLVVAVAFYMTDFRLQVPIGKLIKEIARWSSFGFLARYDINDAGVTTWHGMLWTLPYEIQFYLLLPVLAWGQRIARSPLVLVAGLALLAVFAWQFVYFTTGLFAAAALGWKHRHAPTIWTILSIAGIVGLGATAGYSGPVLQATCLLPILVAVGLQARLFAPLATRPIRFIGEISYSIYILHFPMICIVFMLLVDPGTLNMLGYLERAIALAALGGVIITLSALSYVFVERPLIVWGKRRDRTPRSEPER